MVLVIAISAIRLARVPRRAAAPAAHRNRAPGRLPDFVFYTGCNVLKTPHIAL
jgi:hypothetical protein